MLLQSICRAFLRRGGRNFTAVFKKVDYLEFHSDRNVREITFSSINTKGTGISEKKIHPVPSALFHPLPHERKRVLSELNQEPVNGQPPKIDPAPLGIMYCFEIALSILFRLRVSAHNHRQKRQPPAYFSFPRLSGVTRDWIAGVG